MVDVICSTPAGRMSLSTDEPLRNPMTTDSSDPASLISFALESLPTMIGEDSTIFCDVRDKGGQQSELSLRYTLICLIGLHRASTEGFDVPFDLETMAAKALNEPMETLADTGLALWVSALFDPDSGRGFVDPARSQWKSERTGMHAGLGLTGIVELAKATDDDEIADIAATFRDDVIDQYGGSPSGIFYHTQASGPRRTKPNFATQVYLMVGLAKESMLSGNQAALDAAERCAQALAELQRDDGGWPWIYDTRGFVVEDYEIYAVHQDAMAPMAFLALSDAGCEGMVELAHRGLPWMSGQNDLGIDMVDRENRLIYRSIRRPRPTDRLMLAANSATASALGRPINAGGKRLELNPVCMPYHPGWILEAWVGRVDEPDSSGGPID